MSAHVFAVWDFMSLLKSLQQSLAGTTLPWTPPRSRSLARFINEIVLAEESDEVAPGVTMSHFELYLDAMREVGAHTATIESFVAALEAKVPFAKALAVADAPTYVKTFVEQTLALARDGSPEAVASSFLFGREDLVPAMFRKLLPEVAATRDTVSLRLYLGRHVEVDDGMHGPAARKLLAEICGDDPRRWAMATDAAAAALEARRALWDGVVNAVGIADRGGPSD